MRLISVVTPCYNEEANVAEVYHKVKTIFSRLKGYRYEHIFIDNCSVDKTVALLKKIATKDKNLKIIVNAKNFGWIKSPYYGLLQSSGVAAIYMAADLQDPPDLIPAFIHQWEKGFKIVLGIKSKSEENGIMFQMRKIYYLLMKKISEDNHIDDFTGFGLYDKRFLEILKQLHEPYPYLRGLVSEFGFEIASVPFTQPRRKHGKTFSTFYRLYDVAMLGIVNHSKIPLRLASFFGFGVAIISFFVAMFYLFYKLLNWRTFQLGIAPMTIGIFFFSSVQLIFIGIIGEYIGAIYTQTKNHPLVIEKERINFGKHQADE